MGGRLFYAFFFQSYRQTSRDWNSSTQDPGLNTSKVAILCLLLGNGCLLSMQKIIFTKEQIVRKVIFMHFNEGSTGDLKALKLIRFFQSGPTHAKIQILWVKSCSSLDIQEPKLKRLWSICSWKFVCMPQYTWSTVCLKVFYNDKHGFFSKLTRENEGLKYAVLH